MDGMHVEEPFKVIKMLRISIGSTEISTKLFPLYVLTYLHWSAVYSKEFVQIWNRSKVRFEVGNLNIWKPLYWKLGLSFVDHEIEERKVDMHVPTAYLILS